MLDSIRHFVSRTILHENPAPTPSPSEPDRRVQLAACALLLELAHADGEFSPSELEQIERALGRHFGLDQATADELIALAEAERQQSIDHFQFTRLIASQYDLGQRMVLAEVMWGVVLADGTIAEHEAYLVRKLANLLELEPAYLAQARRAATESQEGNQPG
ncbi:MAG TPA: TerB family tellurite resistance protein [Gemmatimonadales bacterium]|nr:TerB family tellurite resistance protein [Gemmatimonadales bacterium]